MSPQHLFVVGAARSGTKILRDTLAEALGVGAVPYDINFVWRYGRERTGHDLLSADELQERAARFIRRYVDRYASGGAVVEKTVSNALRVPYVAAVFPDARFVHLVRDGVDATQSTYAQWLTPPDRRYLFDKARHFPLRLVPGYGRKYLARALGRGRGGHRGSWGVRYPGIEEDLAAEPLPVVCARQWRECVVRAETAFADGELAVSTVRYEEFVAAPADQLRRLAESLGFAIAPSAAERAASRVTAGSVGKGLRALDPGVCELLAPELDETLTQMDYPTVHARGRDG